MQPSGLSWYIDSIDKQSHYLFEMLGIFINLQKDILNCILVLRFQSHLSFQVKRERYDHSSTTAVCKLVIFERKYLPASTLSVVLDPVPRIVSLTSSIVFPISQFLLPKLLILKDTRCKKIKINRLELTYRANTAFGAGRKVQK